MTVALPDEVVYQIFSYLDALSLGRVLQCSTAFYRIATAPSLWELPYLLRWSTGDALREKERGTDQWRRHKNLQRLEEHARRAAVEKNLAVSPDSPFRYLRLISGQASIVASASLDFYRLFLERIRIDQEVIDSLYQQVEATHSRVPSVTSLALRLGNDAKDVLTSVVQAQTSCPSWSVNGLPAHTANSLSCDQHNTRTARDALTYDSNCYRISAYQAHLPTTLRSDTHHLVILHHAREMLEHLQRREAMQRMSSLSPLSQEPSSESSSGSADHFDPLQTENAVSVLTMFRGGEASYVESQLDALAAACDLYLQQCLPDPSEASPKAIDKAKQMAMSICDFLADHGFRGARDDLFSDLDNHFLHHCFTTNRETLPLSLTLIFCGVANRLGLRASLCNFPMRILAFVSADPEAPWPGPDETLASAPQQLFWLDVCEYTTVAYDAHEPTPTDPFARRASWLQQRPPILDREDLTEWVTRMGIPPSDDFWRPAQPDSMVQRAARNILSSVQRAQITPRTNNQIGQARSAIRNIEIGRRASRLELQWSQLVRVDHAFLSSFYGRTDPIEHKTITDHVANVLGPDTRAGSCLEEDETTWRIVRCWRSESMRALTSASETWVLPAKSSADYLRRWMQERARDNDWTRACHHLHRRADHWSEHEQQAAKYAAVNAFLRLSTQINSREVDWIAGFLQTYFMLDVEVIERDFLGTVQSSVDGDNVEAGSNSSDEGSDSSMEEGGFSIRAARTESREGGRITGLVTKPSVRIVLGRMLQAVRAKDAELPRVNRRVGGDARRKRQSGGMNEATAVENQDDEDLVGYRVGTIFRHRTYRYVGSVLGWDPYCAAPEDWIVNMGVDRLPPPPSPVPQASRRSTSSSSSPTSPASPVVEEPKTHLPDQRRHRHRRGGRHQPFYHSQVADGTRRYVAEVNIEPITGPIWIYGAPPDHQDRNSGEADIIVEEGRVLGQALHRMLELRGLGEYFRCFDQANGRLRRNTDARLMFPDDWSDDDDDYGSSDEEEVRMEQQQQQKTMERSRSEQIEVEEEDQEGEDHLSEDGSW